MVNIKLTEDLRIKSDSLQYILQKKHLTKEGFKKQNWYTIGYFSTIEQLLVHAVQTEMRLSEAKSIAELLDVQKDLESRFTRLVKGIVAK